MPSLDQIASGPAQLMVVGFPKAGKSGALASLANAGFKLRIMNYDPGGGGTKILRALVKPEFYPNVSIIDLADEKRMARFIEAKQPKAFAAGFSLMDDWTDFDSAWKPIPETSLGHSRDWGTDVVVVLDTVTSMGEAAFDRALNMQGKTFENTTDRVWGQAMAEQEAFVKRLMSSSNGFNVVINAHLKMIGPKDVRKGPTGDSEIGVQIKTEIAALIETRYYPSVLGWLGPQQSGKNFPAILEAAFEPGRAGKVDRFFRTQPRAELDLGVPSLDLPAKIPLDDGLLKVFDALGVPRPTKE